MHSHIALKYTRWKSQSTNSFTAAKLLFNLSEDPFYNRKRPCFNTLSVQEKLCSADLLFFPR